MDDVSSCLIDPAVAERKSVGLSALILRVVVAWSVLSALGLAFGGALIRWLLPLIQFCIDALQGDFLGFVSLHDHVISLQCDSARAIPVTPTNYIPAYTSFDGGNTDVLHALVPPLLLGVIVAAVPASGVKEWTLRGVLSALAVIPVVAATTPLLLTSGVYMALVDAARGHGEDAHDPFMVTVSLFMELGGRWVLPIVIGAFCILLGRRWTARVKWTSCA